MIKHTLLFVRQEKLLVKTLAIVEIETNREPIAALIDAVTLWIDDDEDGAEAWVKSSKDFNVGDLALYHESIPEDIWKRAGISSITMSIPSGDKCLSFDTVLYNQNAEENE